jgi:hypothetical protein
MKSANAVYLELSEIPPEDEVHSTGSFRISDHSPKDRKHCGVIRLRFATTCCPASRSWAVYGTGFRRRTGNTQIRGTQIGGLDIRLVLRYFLRVRMIGLLGCPCSPRAAKPEKEYLNERRAF